MKVQNTKSKIFKVVLYIVLTAMALIMLVPFVWMLSASFKLDKDVFIFPIQWIPTNPRWQNYLDIWTRIPLGKFVLNTVKLTLIVTFLQLLTSSFAAYAFAKLSFKERTCCLWPTLPPSRCRGRYTWFPVHDDAFHGTGRYPFVHHFSAGVFGFWRVHDEAVL